MEILIPSYMEGVSLRSWELILTLFVCLFFSELGEGDCGLSSGHLLVLILTP